MFSYLIEKFGRFKQHIPYKIYCQNCGFELTNKGGDVSAFGGIYCDNKIECVVARMKDSPKSIDSNEINVGSHFKYLFLDPTRLQKLISKGKITKYGPLEKAVSNT